MPTIFYGCDQCMKHNPEGSVYNHDQVRVTKDGDWICECCFDDAPEWEYADKPTGWNDAENIFRWSMLPSIPLYVPEST